MNEGMIWDHLPTALLTDCAQLVKANSIEGMVHIWVGSQNIKFMIGNKKDNLTIIYTPADNLKKTGDMEVGQVSFHNEKKGSNFYTYASPHHLTLVQVKRGILNP